jgi:hypothetical protein
MKKTLKIILIVVVLSVAIGAVIYIQKRKKLRKYQEDNFG